MMKDGICTAIGVVGSVIASLFGGWDAALVTLVIFMAIDYVTGLLVAGKRCFGVKSRMEGAVP